jgi:inhibitor of cysteine peptidase
MATIELVQADDGGSRPAATGDEVVLSLEETATSGYRWAVDSIDRSLLELVDDTYDPPDPGRLGGSGVHHFRFRVIAGGTSAIRLVLARSWDRASAVEAFEVTIEAMASGQPVDPADC